MTVFELTLMGIGLAVVACVVLWLSIPDRKADLSFLDPDQPRDYPDSGSDS
jgi:hypothetical protein